jgi:hypothetical protein
MDHLKVTSATVGRTLEKADPIMEGMLCARPCAKSFPEVFHPIFEAGAFVIPIASCSHLLAVPKNR